MKIANISVNRPVGILMVVLIILLLGIVSFSRLSIDLLPDMNIPVAVVITSYDGVGPEEIEKIVTTPIEGQIATLEGVTSITSQSSSGTSAVIAQFTWGTDMDQAMINMREKVDFVKPFLPSDVSQPMIIKIDVNMMPIMMLGVEGESYDLDQLKKIVEDKIQPRLERIEGAAQIDVSGGKTREIQVEISPQLLQSYNLSLTTVSQTLMTENNNVSGGYVEQGKKDYLVRIKGEFTSIQELEKTLIPLPTGGSIELKYLADIKDTYKDVTAYSLLNGQPSISINVQKQSDANTVQVSDEVNKVIAQLQEEMPDIKISTAMDQAEFIHQSIDQVKSNGVVGAILAMVVLLIFLSNVRSTLIIGTAIPISIITTFTLVYFSGLTLNMMTLGGLALGIGMMVDNAIVVLESIYRHRQDGLGRIEAAKKGTAEVGTAIIASTLTTVSVFLPIVFVGGMASQIFKPLALTVSISLVASLLVALSLVPMLSSKLLVIETNGNSSQGLAQRLARRWSAFLEKLNGVYARLLRWALGHRKTVVLITTIALVVSIVLIPFIGMEFIPAQDNGNFTINMTLPNATVLEETELVVEQVEEIVAAIPEVESIFLSVGGGDMLTGNFGGGGNSGNITGRLVPLSQRDRGIEKILDEVRSQVAMIPGAEITVRADDMNMGTQTPISITIKGQDLDTLEGLAEEFAEIIKEVPGTREVETSLGKGNPELTIALDRDKAAQYGISSMQVSQTVRNALQGASASKYRTGGEEIDIRVTLPKEYRQNINDISRLMVTNMQGVNVPLEEIATLQYETGPTSISRVDQSRQVSVNSGLFGRDLKSVTDDIKLALGKIPLPSGYEVEFVGSDQEMMEAFADLGLALIMAIIMMYMILAAQFEALLYPFIIMFSIPPTLIGVILGLLVTGRTFNVVTFIGVIMLAGIVVNNAIILVDYINTLRKEGLEKHEAIIKGGTTRLRPILMTTLTTVLALVPQTLGIGEGSELSSPMATAVVFGLSFSTLITLVLIPVVYYILDEWGHKITKKFIKAVTGETVPERL